MHLYDEGRDGPDRDRLELLTQLREGLERDLVLHYQPKVELSSGRVTGVEALVRWQHPERGLLGPDRFIDLAEAAGLMGRLTRVVLEQALTQVSRWRADGLHLHVAVNTSPWNLADPLFPDVVTDLLARYDLPPEALTLEVTETSLMQDQQQAVHALTRLRAAGVAIAVDDYGTGYSSLAYLTDLPVDELKLDRRFAATVTTDPRTVAVVASTVHLAHALGLTVVMEGVEDEQTLAALVREGCDQAQGYHLGRPVPAAQLLAAAAGRVPRPRRH